MTLAEAFDPKRNALTLWRLIFCQQVVFWHVLLTTGRTNIVPHALMQLASTLAVDIFFAMSGFLITMSWEARPQARDYLAARALRILPALWVCLILTAFVIAPIGIAIQGGSVKNFLSSTGPITYVLSNFFVFYLRQDINGTPMGVPVAGSWDSPLWSLSFEVLCYASILVVGLLGLVKYRWLSIVVFFVSAVLAVLQGPLLWPGVWTLGQLATRCFIMFAAGAAMYQWRDKIPANWWLVALCTVLVFVAGALAPDYRVVAGWALAYAVIVSAALVRNMNLHHDFSYAMYIYSFPVQQIMVMAGLISLSPLLFYGLSVAFVFPIAVASWFLIERRAIRLKRKIRAEGPAPTGAY